jgi:two-component system OmpR family response regulator
MRILVAEDDKRTADYLVKGLTESGHAVDSVADGEAALTMARERRYDALVLDLKLPGLDGLTLVRRLRRRDPRTPVLMLSGAAGTADRVEGLRAGCDDYLAKPYSFIELLARLETLQRRATHSHAAPILRIADLELDSPSRTVSRAGKLINLSRHEFLMLEHLMRHTGEVMNRARLLEAAWAYDAAPRGGAVDMHIYRLRQKVDDGFSCPLISTVAGAGYTMRDPAERADAQRAASADAAPSNVVSNESGVPHS